MSQPTHLDSSALDAHELLLWSIVLRLEQEAVSRYGQFCPEISIASKREFIDQLTQSNASEAVLESGDWKTSLDRFLQAAEANDELSVLLVNALMLERLGQTVYEILINNSLTTEKTKHLARLGLSASREVTSKAMDRLEVLLPDGDSAFQSFATTSKPVLLELNDLSEQMDRDFGEPLGLEFSEMIAEFTAELLVDCVGLGMSRREVMCHLAGAFMERL